MTTRPEERVVAKLQGSSPDNMSMNAMGERNVDDLRRYVRRRLLNDMRPGRCVFPNEGGERKGKEEVRQIVLTEGVESAGMSTTAGGGRTKEWTDAGTSEVWTCDEEWWRRIQPLVPGTETDSTMWSGWHEEGDHIDLWAMMRTLNTESRRIASFLHGERADTEKTKEKLEGWLQCLSWRWRLQYGVYVQML